MKRFVELLRSKVPIFNSQALESSQPNKLVREGDWGTVYRAVRIHLLKRKVVFIVFRFPFVLKFVKFRLMLANE